MASPNRRPIRNSEGALIRRRRLLSTKGGANLSRGANSDKYGMYILEILKLRLAVGTTKLIGQLHWVLFIVIQSVFCFGLFVYMFIGT